MATPTLESARLPPSDIRIEPCAEKDAEEIADGIYEAFGEAWWSTREPPSMRPPLHSTRVSRLAARTIRPSFSMPNVYWVKATYIPTNKIIGVAGWQAPGSPVHTFWRRSATQFYKWDEKYNWSEADVEEMWQGVDMSVWEGGFEKDDKARQEVLGDEPHWYLAPLFTRPEFKGRGIGSMLLKWGIEQADATNPVTPMYLESSEYAVKVYEHVGFVNLGKNSFVRRGPKVKDSSEGLPKAKEEEGTVGKGSTEVVVEEVKAKAA